MKAAAIAVWIAISAVPGAAFAQEGIGCTALTGPDLADCLRQQSEPDNGTASSGTPLDSTAGGGTSGLSTGTIATGSGSLADPQGTQGTFSLQPAPTFSFGPTLSPVSPSLRTSPLSTPQTTSGTTGGMAGSGTVDDDMGSDDLDDPFDDDLFDDDLLD